MALFDIADNMQKCGLTIKQINVSGGFVRSSHWLQILANVFNKKICLVNSDDASAMGAAFLALKAMNFIDSYNELKPSVIKEILPQDEYLKLYQDKFLIYRNLYKSLRAQMISQNE
jgi:gluconokinase